MSTQNGQTDHSTFHLIRLPLHNIILCKPKVYMYELGRTHTMMSHRCHNFLSRRWLSSVRRLYTVTNTHTHTHACAHTNVHKHQRKKLEMVMVYHSIVIGDKYSRVAVGILYKTLFHKIKSIAILHNIVGQFLENENMHKSLPFYAFQNIKY